MLAACEREEYRFEPMRDLRLEPKRAWVTTSGLVAVTVSGRGIGFVSCGQQRRFVWGRFVECFLVPVREPTSLVVSARGLTGAATWSLKLSPRADVTPKQLTDGGARRYPRLRPVKFRAVPIPRLKPSLLEHSP